jgi:hypothetical protein
MAGIAVLHARSLLAARENFAAMQDPKATAKPLFIASTAPFAVLAALFYFARIYSRVVPAIHLFWDDYLITLGFVRYIRLSLNGHALTSPGVCFRNMGSYVSHRCRYRSTSYSLHSSGKYGESASICLLHPVCRHLFKLVYKGQCMRNAFTNHAEQEMENWIVDHDSEPGSHWHCQYRYLSDNVQPSICLLAH